MFTKLARLDRMKTWSLERAKNGFSEVVRRALDHEPQLVTRGRSGADAVVVVAREDYEKLISPTGLADVLRASPLAEAIAAGELSAGAFDRSRDFGREVDLG
jgi:prevent-host-death family protein